MVNSRIPGFYKQSLSERQRRVVELLGLDAEATSRQLSNGGLTADMADKIVENVIGIYALPLGLGLNFQINGRDRLLPMVVEEPSVIAAASNAAKMIRLCGGFQAEQSEPLMIAQIELRKIADSDGAFRRLAEHKSSLLERAQHSLPGLVARGGGARDLEVRRIADDHLVVHLLVDCCDAMGANLVNGAAETLGPELAQLTGGQLGLRILSNLADRRVVSVQARASGSDLAPPGQDPCQVLDAIEAASHFAELDPYRAATHNKGIMNGTDSVVIATGNDYRAVEAGAHAYAARTGRYTPLATWSRDGGELVGKLTMPMALGVVGGTLRVHPGARLALDLAEVEGASDLALLAGCAGLASNLAAIRALATEGIQRGHMSLHARSVAIAAGARGAEVERVAATLASHGRINQSEAESVLDQMKNHSTPKES